MLYVAIFYLHLRCSHLYTKSSGIASIIQKLLQNHKISTKLLSWFNARRQELSVDSRTSALWLNYVHYVLIVLEFICAERTSNWPLYILATKSMLNLFAATVLTGSIYNLCSVWKRITQTSTNSLFWETIPSGVQAAAVLASGLIFPLNKS